ncbi:MAG: hypothetical protein M1838_002135 [Thelocarpon superellum]|nr:MAG: hypothetical protein M1838_002135 [Thelocarpon superellum]
MDEVLPAASEPRPLSGSDLCHEDLGSTAAERTTESSRGPQLQSPTCTSTVTAMLPPPRPSESRAASQPTGSGKRSGKRLTLSFPVQPQSPRPTPSSPVQGTPPTPGPSMIGERSVLSPSESGSFLVDLAAQERRVFELKEELHRAERDLERLKRQWALHEAARKRDEMRHMEQMQRFHSTVGSVEGSGDEGLALTRASLDRGASGGAGGAGGGGDGRDTKTSRRTVISGQTHTRTLSLLSPERKGPPPKPMPHSRRLTEPNVSNGVPPESAQHPTLSGSTSSPAMATTTTTIEDVLPAPSKDALLKTGRRIAEDFKEGLYTFFDDLRQATVGDEPVYGPGARAANSALTPSAKRPTLIEGSGGGSDGVDASVRQSPGTRSQMAPNGGLRADDGALIDIGGTFWNDHGSEAMDTKQAKGLGVSNLFPADASAPSSHSAAVSEGWDAWASSGTQVSSSGRSSSTLVSEVIPSPSSGLGGPTVSRSQDRDNVAVIDQALPG